MPTPFYPASVLLFQIHGGMVSHMQVHTSQLYIILNTWILTSENILVLAACSLEVVETHPLFPYFLERRLAIPVSPFFIY